MELNEQQTILITKDLTSEISGDEKLILESELANNLELREIKEILHKFWFHFFPKTQSHQIIQKTETKLGFTSHSKVRFLLWMMSWTNWV